MNKNLKRGIQLGAALAAFLGFGWLFSRTENTEEPDPNEVTLDADLVEVEDDSETDTDEDNKE